MIQEAWILVPADCHVTSDNLLGLGFSISTMGTTPNGHPVSMYPFDKPGSFMPV